MKAKYLITGATGFVGSWVTRALVQSNEDVSILVRNKNLNERIKDLTKDLHIYETDLQNPKLAQIIDKIKPNIVIHMAAYGALPGQLPTVEDLIETNVKGFINLIHTVKKHNIDMFINTGSSSEYGIKNSAMIETDSLLPINDYGVSKAAATLYAQKIALTEGFPIVTLRLFSPFGFHDDKKRLIQYVIENALANKPISLNSQTNVRDFIYIEDVINAYLSVIKMKVAGGEIINIGSGKQHTVYDIVKNVVEITKSTSAITWGTMSQQSRQVEPKIWQADITKAKKLLHWQPKFSLHEGLAKTIKYSKKENL